MYFKKIPKKFKACNIINAHQHCIDRNYNIKQITILLNYIVILL